MTTTRLPSMCSRLCGRRLLKPKTVSCHGLCSPCVCEIFVVRIIRTTMRWLARTPMILMFRILAFLLVRRALWTRRSKRRRSSSQRNPTVRRGHWASGRVDAGTELLYTKNTQKVYQAPSPYLPPTDRARVAEKYRGATVGTFAGDSQ